MGSHAAAFCDDEKKTTKNRDDVTKRLKSGVVVKTQVVIKNGTNSAGDLLTEERVRDCDVST